MVQIEDCGFVYIIGIPSAGKSIKLNCLCHIDIECIALALVNLTNFKCTLLSVLKFLQ